jgi:hypothetical protein
MRLWSPLLACFASLACGASIPKGVSTEDVSGTYDFAACDSDPCSRDSPTVYAYGSVVLANEPLEFRNASTRLMARLSLDADQRNPKINGCFALRVPRRKIGTVLGEVSAGALDWKRGTDGLVRFYMYYNVGEQAEYQVIARFDPDGAMEGAGSWKIRSPHLSRDYLWARRRGPPDAEACRVAIEARFNE